MPAERRGMPPLASQNVRDLLATAAAWLEEAGVEEGKRNATLLLAHLLRCRPEALPFLDPPIDRAFVACFRELLERRARREPLQYILGEWDFWDFTIEVSPEVLIPRPETEVLVERVLSWAKGTDSLPIKAFLDLGTGSGAIALALLRELPGSRGVAVDISEGALAVARRNAERLALLPRLTLLLGDLFAPLPSGVRFPLIVSNPPYVAWEAKSCLQPEIVEHEPHVALFASRGGLEIIERILTEAPRRLLSGGGLFIEIGEDQAAAVEAFARQTGKFRTIDIHEDLAGRPRIFAAVRE
ncbi:MAG: peptide chain release factor N(5)-glutamine methyltransferase [Deltaproteobacteria bacterium]|nr:MAG: peptide chain release factor N(5)-glutamine methyltransferase [Deltaproteobacteria bacterium]